jgi:glycosyltransferase involved in cell wall biosynthesis
MSNRRKKRRHGANLTESPTKTPSSESRLWDLYDHACRLAESGDVGEARRLYDIVGQTVKGPKLKALVTSDRAALAALEGETDSALQGFVAALAIDSDCEPARANLALLEAESPSGDQASSDPALVCAPSGPSNGIGQRRATKVAILSFLFNWPSTGGGIVHTAELIQFLGRAGYEVKHFYARHLPWGIGQVEGALPFASEALEFDEAGWNWPAIQRRLRQAVAAFDPDHVIITDSWNMKPLLAEAVQGYPYILRFQAMECLCPLNGVRLLPDGAGGFRQCHRHQLANPEACCRCLQENGRLSGGLHQAERALSGVGSSDYYQRLLHAVREAEAVLVVNPLHEAMFSPYNDHVRVVTAGMDPARFPWPWPDDPAEQAGKTVRSLFFAGLVEEPMKGFAVLHEACSRLWRRRQDFELVATGDPPGRVNAFTRFVGWLSQEELPRHLRAADMVVMPTVAQEALGRTAVEAMAVGRPVIASRLGGLPFTVLDGATGLLCEPGDPEDLGRKIEMLLNDAGLRERLGLAGRRRFEEQYAWDVIIERHYRPLLSRRPGDFFATKSHKKTQESQ